MNCRMTELRAKEVVSVKDGCRLGPVCDLEVDMKTGQLTAIVVYGRNRGLFGREEDIVIPWKDITVLGDDTILVNYAPASAAQHTPARRRGYGESLFK